MDPEAAQSKSSQKRQVVASACTSCQKRKSKCDGKRPSCSSCKRRGTDCQYDSDDLRRITNLRSLNQKLNHKITSYEQFVTLLQQEPEENAFDIFRRLRASPGDAAGYIEQLTRGSTHEDDSYSPVETDPGSASGLSSPVETDASFRGSNWHPALQIREPRTQRTHSHEHGSARDYNVYEAQSANVEQREHSGPSAIGKRSPGYSQAAGPSALPRGERSIPSASSWLGSDRSAERYATPGYVEVFGNLPMSSAIVTASYPESIQSQQMLNYRIPIHLVQPVVVVEDSPLSRVYTDYRDAARQLIASGAPLAEIVGPQDYVNVDLFYRDRRPTDPFSANFWACETCKTFDEFDDPVKLGAVALLTYFMRWLLNPTPESYANVPDLMKPTPSQRLIPHVPAIDTLIIPEFRDAVISRFRDWISPLSESTELWCPYTFAECVETDVTTGCRRLTKQFEECVKNPKNWSWDKSVLESFPEVNGRVRLRE